MAKKEYIEREVAIKELCQVSAPTPSESYIVEKCVDKIDNMLAADVVEVVRCKNCQYFIPKDNLTDEYDNPIGADGFCDNFPRQCYTDKQDYCSCGKRKID